jgi:hypothetical protein
MWGYFCVLRFAFGVWRSTLRHVILMAFRKGGFRERNRLHCGLGMPRSCEESGKRKSLIRLKGNFQLSKREDRFSRFVFYCTHEGNAQQWTIVESRYALPPRPPPDISPFGVVVSY